jgi:hypothetical protein
MANKEYVADAKEDKEAVEDAKKDKEAVDDKKAVGAANAAEDTRDELS